MNTSIQKLSVIAGKPMRRIIGLMSGTSLDGLDIAVCEVTGSGPGTRVAVTHFETVSYPDEVKTAIREVFAKRTIDFQQLCLLNPWIGRLHAEWIMECLHRWGLTAEGIDLIASHGQTVFHCPKALHGLPAMRAMTAVHGSTGSLGLTGSHGLPDWPDGTLQIGDGDHIAVGTGIITVSDFRQKHIAAGGEGAPLALYGDYFLFSRAGEDRLLLNMGGIANFTFLPGSLDPREVFVTDTGPGNTLIDAAARLYFGKDFDQDAALARQGTVHRGLLAALQEDPFFRQPFPRTTGPELFNLDYVSRKQAAIGASGLSAYDMLATLTRLSADTIVGAVREVLGARGGAGAREAGSAEGRARSTGAMGAGATGARAMGAGGGTTEAMGVGSAEAGAVAGGAEGEAMGAGNVKIYMSGGGAHNPLLTEWIREGLGGIPLYKTDVLGVAGDAKEAVLFAVLANEAVAGEPIDFGKPGMPGVRMGKVSFPG